MLESDAKYIALSKFPNLRRFAVTESQFPFLPAQFEWSEEIFRGILFPQGDLVSISFLLKKFGFNLSRLPSRPSCLEPYIGSNLPAALRATFLHAEGVRGIQPRVSERQRGVKYLNKNRTPKAMRGLR